jgi:reactive intermediate/imine deaminase
MTRTAIRTKNAPPPAGTYSQAISATGRFLFISGQTPRTLDGVRLTGSPFLEQARRALENLQAIAMAAELSLNDAVKVTVYLRNLSDAPEFDRIYTEYVSKEPLPARTLVQSAFGTFDIEIDAILHQSDER